MPKNKRLMSGLLAVPLVTILLIAGCSVGSPEPTETSNPSPSISAPADPSATPAPAETEEPSAPEVTVGANVDAATAAEMNGNKDGQYRAYAMPDGSNVVIDRTAPLPDAVQADVNNKGEALAQQYPDILQSATPAGQQAIGQQIGAITQATGKKVILVVRVNGYMADQVTPVTNYYPTGGGMAPDGTIRSRGELEAHINAFLSSRNANEYVVVWPN